MDLSTVARLPVGERLATLFAALELSKATWPAARLNIMTKPTRSSSCAAGR